MKTTSPLVYVNVELSYSTLRIKREGDGEQNVKEPVIK
jgi:hypothetical protein